VIHRFEAKDGRQVTLRTPKWEDLNDLMGLMNSLIEERADITLDKKVTLEEEADWLGRKLANLENDKLFCLVAEVDGKVVANSQVEGRGGPSRHVGELFIGIREGYRDLGIGTEMLRSLIAQAKEKGLRVLTFRVFSTNKRAIHVYSRMGFTETGRVPKEFYKDGEYIDSIIMVKEL
jgi:RimJ/RimL family protein N-acetyltransferase